MNAQVTRAQVISILGFTVLYIAIAAVVAHLSGNGEFVFYIAVMLILAGAILWVHHSVHLSLGLLWCLSLWGLMHMAGGLVPLPDGWHANGPIHVLYSWWIIPDLLKYDQVVHAYGFACTTWLCWQALGSAIHARCGQRPTPTLGLLTLCAAAGMGFGALNEVVEFIATLTMPKTNVGGYRNTGWDLVANLVGALVASGLIRFRSGAGKASKVRVAPAS